MKIRVKQLEGPNSAGYVLKTDGSGNVAWGTNPSQSWELHDISIPSNGVTSFTLPAQVPLDSDNDPLINVYINGLRIDKSDFTVTNTTLDLSNIGYSLATTDSLQVMYASTSAPAAGFSDNVYEGQAKVEAFDDDSAGGAVIKFSVDPSDSGSPTEVWNIDGDGHIIPQSNSTYDLGKAELKVRHLYLSNNSLKFGPSNDNTITGTVSASGDGLSYNSELLATQAYVTANAGGGGGTRVEPSDIASSPFTIGTDDSSIASTELERAYFCKTSAAVVNLPTAVGLDGFKLQIKNLLATAITVTPNGSETIDGLASYSLSTQYESITLLSDNLNWYII